MQRNLWPPHATAVAPGMATDPAAIHRLPALSAQVPIGLTTSVMCSGGRPPGAAQCCAAAQPTDPSPPPRQACVQRVPGAHQRLAAEDVDYARGAEAAEAGQVLVDHRLEVLRRVLHSSAAEAVGGIEPHTCKAGLLSVWAGLKAPCQCVMLHGLMLGWPAPGAALLTPARRPHATCLH